MLTQRSRNHMIVAKPQTQSQQSSLAIVSCSHFDATVRVFFDAMQHACYSIVLSVDESVPARKICDDAFEILIPNHHADLEPVCKTLQSIARDTTHGQTVSCYGLRVPLVSLVPVRKVLARPAFHRFHTDCSRFSRLVFSRIARTMP